MDNDYSSTPKHQHTPNTYPAYAYMVPPMAAQPFPNMLPVPGVQNPYQHPQPPIIWVPVNTHPQQHTAYAHQGHPYYAYPPPPPPQPRQTAQMHFAQPPLHPPPAQPTGNHNRVPKRISPAFVGITRTTSTTTSSSSSHQATRQTGDSDADDANQDTDTHDTGEVEDLMVLNFGEHEPQSISSNSEWMTSSWMEAYEEDGEANDAIQQHVDDELETQGALSYADTGYAMDEEYMPQDDSDDDTDDMEQEDKDEWLPRRTRRVRTQRHRGSTSRRTDLQLMKGSRQRRLRVTAGSGTETGTSSTLARRAKNGDTGAGKKAGVNKTNKLPDGVVRKGWKLGPSDDRSHSNKKEHTALLKHMHTLANEHPIDHITDLTTLQARVVVCHGTLNVLVRQIQLSLGNIPLSQGDMALCLTLLGRDMDQNACSSGIKDAGLAMGVTEGGLKVCWLEDPHDHSDPNYALLHLLMTEMDTLGDRPHPSTWKEHKQTQLWLQEARRPADNDSDPHWTQCDYDHHLTTTMVEKWHPESVRSGWTGAATCDERGSCTAREFQTLLAHMKARAAKHPRHQHAHEHHALRELINNGSLLSLLRHIILALGNVGVPPVDLAFFVRLLRPQLTYQQVQNAISTTLTRGVTSLSLKITWLDTLKRSDATLHTLLHTLVDRITPHITTRPTTIDAVNALDIPELVLPEPTKEENMAVEDGLPDGVVRSGWTNWRKSERMHSNKKEHTALLKHTHNLANEHPIDNIPDLMTLQARVVVCHGTLLTLVRQIQLALGNIPLSQGDMALCLTLLGRDMDQQACSNAIDNAGLAMGVTKAGLKVCWLEEPHDHGDPNYALLHLLITEMDTLGNRPHPSTWKEHEQTQLRLQKARRPADNNSDPHWTQCDYDHHLATTNVEMWHPESVRSGWSSRLSDERGSCTAREFQTLLAHMKARAAKYPRHQHSHEYQSLRELINNGNLLSLVRHIILALGNVGVPPVDLAFFVRLLRPRLTYQQVQRAISNTLNRGVTSLSLKIAWLDNRQPSDATLHTLLHTLIDRITPHITTRPTTVALVNAYPIASFTLPKRKDPSSSSSSSSKRQRLE